MLRIDRDQPTYYERGYFEIWARTYRKPGYCTAFWTLGAGSEPGQNAEIDMFDQAGHFEWGGHVEPVLAG